MNAMRHNLTGQVTTMTDDDRAAHDKLSKSIIASLAPEGGMEVQLAQRIATDSWRLNRASAIEDNLFALGLYEHSGKIFSDFDQAGHEQIDASLTTAQVFTLQSKQLQLLTLYEQRIHRTMQKNLKQLVELQTARRAAESSQKARRDQALDEARLLTRLAEIKGVPYGQALSPECGGNETHVWSAEPNGFVFSNAEIAASIRRESLLTEARQLLRPANKHSGPITTTLAA